MSPFGRIWLLFWDRLVDSAAFRLKIEFIYSLNSLTFLAKSPLMRLFYLTCEHTLLRRCRMSCRAGVSCHTRSVSLHTTTVPSLNLNGNYCGENYSLCREANNFTCWEELSELDGANPNFDIGQSTCNFVRIGPYNTPGSVGVEWSPGEPFCHVIVYYLLGPSAKSPVTCEHSWTESKSACSQGSTFGSGDAALAIVLAQHSGFGPQHCINRAWLAPAHNPSTGEVAASGESAGWSHL